MCRICLSVLEDREAWKWHEEEENETEGIKSIGLPCPQLTAYQQQIMGRTAWLIW